MHDRSIAGMNPKPAPDVEMTAFIYRLFGGKIRSQVKCTQCSYESNTYDPFLDLSLEITHANSVEKALHRFTTGEVLDGSNKYRCPRQEKPVRAIKRMTVEEAPNVLVIQLKRFEFSLSGRKISKPVEFGETLDLTPYMSKKPARPVQYDLYGVLVHQGHSMHSGHYFCFIKWSVGGDWHRFDDTRVSPVRTLLGLTTSTAGNETSMYPVERSPHINKTLCGWFIVCRRACAMCWANTPTFCSTCGDSQRAPPPPAPWVKPCPRSRPPGSKPGPHPTERRSGTRSACPRGPCLSPWRWR
jgi:hypothetical protein